MGDQPPVPGENRVWFGHAGHLLQSFPPEPLSDLTKCASLEIRQAQPCWQVGAENSVLRRQVLILERIRSLVPFSEVEPDLDKGSILPCKLSARTTPTPCRPFGCR